MKGENNHVVAVIGDGEMTAGQAYKARNQRWASLFEELGLYYIGPVDGHNVEDLVDILNKVKEMPASDPVLIHIITEKGNGRAPAEVASDKMHDMVKFEPRWGKQLKAKSSTRSFTQYIAEAEADDKIVAIHAAMGGGTGLNLFQKQFSERYFDVGITEHHAVTFAAGLATEGLKPFCAVYSFFLQRGYDQRGYVERIFTLFTPKKKKKHTLYI
ncbi:hypothetical protein FEM48_Zijuj01G0004400 [Ziziphus jujuba var. spinosa]|uniref:Transketolase-like pyrimidine-binding domain-containing protein n=1 Tax=Ziziphus jujuba var. spinosa TaxID=714518 RepID=A0A978VY30_ZIZJJ|nr:hypothetical protein FEM48_Zijuj01G0004400 [Ziziphus jujuba var. spinosa]